MGEVAQREQVAVLESKIKKLEQKLDPSGGDGGDGGGQAQALTSPSSANSAASRASDTSQIERDLQQAKEQLQVRLVDA